jgi:hypothetical protein
VSVVQALHVRPWRARKFAHFRDIPQLPDGRKRMSKFIIEPHFRLQEWVAEEKGYFRLASSSSFARAVDLVEAARSRETQIGA